MDRRRIFDMTKQEIKLANLNTLADYQEKLCQNPQLRQLFFELTLRCNEACFHCGSSCASNRPDGLHLEKLKDILDEVKAEFGTGVKIALTGGEPFLYPDFFAFTEYLHKQGFRWGMTSNATLITKEVAEHLRDTGMTGISVSIDGLPETHDRYRNYPGGYRLAMEGLQNLIEAAEGSKGCEPFTTMVTTVVNHENIREIPALFDIFDHMDINEWRLTGIEPIGRALNFPDMLLTPEDNRWLMEYIKAKREEKLPVEYSCCHFLGLEYEAEVRDWYFLCNAGIYVAAIMENGDVGACLDIPRNNISIQGNVLNDSFTRIWKEEFQFYRTPLSDRNETCRACPEKRFCRGGSYHSWSFEKEEPRVCFKDVLF